MLVLTRRAGEKIRIGDEIEVTVLRMSGDRVRIGIDAPREIRVLRTEIAEQEASTTPTNSS
jgi:carbon storage regulator